MRNKIILLLLAAGAVLSLTGCEKEPSANGSAVKFSLITGTPQTKTEYSRQGANSGGNATNVYDDVVWERIDWVAGDKLLVWSDNAVNKGANNSNNAKYTVGNPEINQPSSSESFYHGKETESWSKAAAESETNELFYGDDPSTTYTFWGMYPYPLEVPAGLEGNTSPGYNIPATQYTKSTDTSVDGLTIMKPDMSYATMFAVAGPQLASKSVELRFYPGYTAYEFTLGTTEDLKLKSFTLTSESSYLSGDVTKATIAANGASTYDIPSGDAKTVSYSFGESGFELKEGDFVEFTVFALPEDVNNLTISVNIDDGTENGMTLTSKLKKGTGENAVNALDFGKCKKHRIKGIYLNNKFDFTYLTLDIDVLEWTSLTSTISNGSGVQATQFAISFDDDGEENVEHNLRYVKGNDKAYRQCWVFTSANTATVTYKIMMPTATTGTWSIEKCGDVDAFTVTVTSPSGATWDDNTVSGSLSGETATYITFTITTSATAVKTLYFKTYVSDGTNTYSLDSETQLYDMRGYHYFIANGDASTTWDDINL